MAWWVVGKGSSVLYNYVRGVGSRADRVCAWGAGDNTDCVSVLVAAQWRPRYCGTMYGDLAAT